MSSLLSYALESVMEERDHLIALDHVDPECIKRLDQIGATVTRDGNTFGFDYAGTTVAGQPRIVDALEMWIGIVRACASEESEIAT